MSSKSSWLSRRRRGEHSKPSSRWAINKFPSIDRLVSVVLRDQAFGLSEAQALFIVQEAVGLSLGSNGLQSSCLADFGLFSRPSLCQRGPRFSLQSQTVCSQHQMRWCSMGTSATSREPSLMQHAQRNNVKKKYILASAVRLS